MCGFINIYVSIFFFSIFILVIFVGLFIRGRVYFVFSKLGWG